VNKFQALAARVAETRKKFDQRADDLALRVDSFDSRANEVFEKHESALTQAEGDMKDLDDALRDMAGGNNPPGERGEEGSAASSTATFQPGGDRG
jgi:hypothetical protein